MKHHVQGVLANISAMMPCFTLNSSKLPKVTGEKADLLPALFCGMEPARPLCMATRPQPLVISSPVSHHDAEIPFNPSFIESPSAAWASDSSFSSFDTDNEGPEYSVPPREGDTWLHIPSLLHSPPPHSPCAFQGYALGPGCYFRSLIFPSTRTSQGHTWPHAV